jgi:2-keto-4-pentenoate hydratase
MQREAPSMNANPTQADAVELLRQHAAHTPFQPAPPPSATTLPAAYDVQRAYVALLARDAGATVGYKIGLTSARMQAMCGIAEPISGCVLATRVHTSGVVLERSAFGRLGLEFEIAVRVGHDVPAAEQTAHSVRRHVDAVCAGVEIVDDRHADYARLDVRGLVADNSWNAGVVLSRWVSEWPDLPAVKGTVSVDGQEIDHGFGRDVLGDPLGVVAWLANHLLARGERLKAGQIVMTGSLVPTRFPTEDAAYHYELEGIGSVDVGVTG